MYKSAVNQGIERRLKKLFYQQLPNKTERLKEALQQCGVQLEPF
jgi:hypothetical protein